MGESRVAVWVRASLVPRLISSYRAREELGTRLGESRVAAWVRAGWQCG